MDSDLNRVVAVITTGAKVDVWPPYTPLLNRENSV